MGNSTNIPPCRSNKFKNRIFLALLMLSGVHLSTLPTLAAGGFKQPDILVLGDSQIAFRSGSSYLRFFKNLDQYCLPDKEQSQLLEKLGRGTVGVIGVRSSTLSSWANKSYKKKKICDVDPKWKVNAGTYGIINRTREKYVQIGQDKQYQFCKKGLSPFEALFQKGNYAPKLLVLSFLGNSAKDWAEHPNKALVDVQKTIKQLPENLPCIYMTTAPPYTQRSIDIRLKAQKNLNDAFKKTGSRCSFVEGLNPKTIAANLDNKRHFRLKKSGAVKDPYHPNKRGARKFFFLQKHDICTALFTQLANRAK
jgi:hypothetical protein